LAALAGDAGSRGMGNPALPPGAEERFARELTRSTTDAALEPASGSAVRRWCLALALRSGR